MNIFLKLCCQLFVHLNEFSATALVFSQEKDLFREEYLSDPESEFLLKKAKKIWRIQFTRNFLEQLDSSVLLILLGDTWSSM